MTTIADQITALELDLVTATGAKGKSLQRRIGRLRTQLAEQQAADEAATAAEPLEDGADSTPDAPDQTTGVVLDDDAGATAEPVVAITDTPVEVGYDDADGDTTTNADGGEEDTDAPATGEPAEITVAVVAQPGASPRPKRSLAEKVRARASELAAHPMPLEEGSKFAPARRVETGMFLSVVGQLVTSRHGDGWRVSEWEIAEGDVRVVGEATQYPTAQQALMAVRVQMTAGVA